MYGTLMGLMDDMKMMNDGTMEHESEKMKVIMLVMGLDVKE